MALDGVHRDINLIGKLKRFTLLACLKSDYTRGTMFSDGSKLKILGSHDATSISRTTGNTINLKGIHQYPIDYNLSFTTTLVSIMTDVELVEYFQTELTLFFVDPVRLKKIEGYSDSARDFTDIQGCLSAIIVHGCYLNIDTVDESRGLTKTTFSVNKIMDSLTDGFFKDELVGTYRMFWDWKGVSSTSLVDSINGVTLVNDWDAGDTGSDPAGHVNDGQYGYSFNNAGGDKEFMHNSDAVEKFQARNGVLFIELDVRSDETSLGGNWRHLLNMMNYESGGEGSGFTTNYGWAAKVIDSDSIILIGTDANNAANYDFTADITMDTSSYANYTIGIDFINSTMLVHIIGGAYQKFNFKIELEQGTNDNNYINPLPSPTDATFYIAKGYNNAGAAWDYWDGIVSKLGIST